MTVDHKHNIGHDLKENAISFIERLRVLLLVRTS